MPLKPIRPNTDKPKSEREYTGGERRDEANQVRKEREWREAVNKGYNNEATRRYK